MEINFIGNIDIARRYLKFECNISAYNWRDLYIKYKSDKIDFPEYLLLVHPRLLQSELDKHPVFFGQKKEILNEIYGPHTFASRNTSNLKCQAQQIWGYECTFESPIEKDHFFPYSKGGPTLQENLLFLCKTHNRMKGSDIHLYSWSKGKPIWFDELLDKIVKYLIVG